MSLELEMLYQGEVEKFQEHAQDVEDADRCRTQSTSPTSSDDCGGPDPVFFPRTSDDEEGHGLVTTWWVPLLKQCANATTQQGFPSHPTKKLSIGSACTGCSAESAVFQEGFWVLGFWDVGRFFG